jgi:SAM-dependent MidA family methyltransferase
MSAPFYTVETVAEMLGCKVAHVFDHAIPVSGSPTLRIIEVAGHHGVTGRDLEAWLATQPTATDVHMFISEEKAAELQDRARQREWLARPD